MSYVIEYTESAKEDLKHLDGSQRKQVLAAINKVSQNPLPKRKGGYGNPLGNRDDSKLAGYLKIKLLRLGVRVVYELVKAEESDIMKIVIIAMRSDVYEEAARRIETQDT